MNPVDIAATNSEVNSLGGDWVSYVLGVSSDDGSQIGAVDVDLRGLFHQRWNWDGDLSDFAPSPGGMSTATADSHLLLPQNALMPVVPLEDNNSSSSYASLPDVPGSIDYGVGSRLRGVWGIPGAATTSMNLAYVVIPRGYESQLEYAIDVGSPTGDLFRFRQGASFPALPPEPPAVVPDTLPKQFNPLPSVVMPIPEGWQPTVPPQSVAPEVSPTAPSTAAPSLFPWITELDRSTDPTLPYGCKAYKFGVTISDGGSIAAVDLRIGSGPMQVVKDLDEDGVPDPIIRGAATTGADSHLLIPDGSVVMPLSEQVYSDPIGIVMSDRLGNDLTLFQTQQMGGAWGIPNELQSDTAELAYIVVDQNADIQRIGLHLEVASRIGDTFLPTKYLMAKDFNLVDANGNVIQPAIVHVPPIVEEPPAPIDLPVVVEEQPGPENPEGIPEIVVEDPPVETPGEGQPEPPFNGEITIMPIPVRPIVWDPAILVPAIDWRLYFDPTNAIIDTTLPFDDYVDYVTLGDEDSDGRARTLLTSLAYKSFLTNAASASNVALYAYDGGLGSAAASAPEPSGVVLAALAMLGVASLGRKRGDR